MITHQIIFNYLKDYIKDIKNYDLKEVVSFFYFHSNKYIRVRYTIFEDIYNTIKWVDISVDNVQSYISKQRELLINQILT